MPVAHHNTGTHTVCTGGDPGDHRMSRGCDPVSAAAVVPAAASCGPRTASSARLARVPRRSMRCLEPLLARSADHADSASWCALVTSAVGGFGPPDRVTWPCTCQSLVRRTPEREPLIGRMVAPFCLLCVISRQSSLLFSWPDTSVAIVCLLYTSDAADE